MDLRGKSPAAAPAAPPPGPHGAATPRVATDRTARASTVSGLSSSVMDRGPSPVMDRFVTRTPHSYPRTPPSTSGGG